MSIVEWFLSFVFKIKTYPLIIQMTIVLTLGFIISTIVLVITIYVIRRNYNRIQKKLKKNVPEIKTLFEEVLFFDKKFSEKEIFDKFENIVGEVNKETIDIGIGILIEFKNKEKKSINYFLLTVVSIINVLLKHPV